MILNGSFNRDLKEKLKDLSSKMIHLSQRRFDELGELDSGLYGYYVSRLKTADIFNQDDYNIMNYFMSRFDYKTKILEVAAGCGQVSFALQTLGYVNTEMSEFDSRRIAYAESLRDGLAIPLQIHALDFRELELKAYHIIFVMNAVASSIGAQDADLLIDAINSGTAVIIKYGYYGVDDKIFDILAADESVTHKVIFKTNKEVRCYTMSNNEQQEV